MSGHLKISAIEEGLIAITAAFLDEDGAAVVPNELTWSLADQDGAVVNGREDEAITPAAEVVIVLQGDDLALPEGRSDSRTLIVEGTYDSDLGSDLPIRDFVTFRVVKLGP